MIIRNDLTPIQVLVPGAGLGRLSWELARLGYACQGNEVSLYMLIASHFVLNKSDLSDNVLILIATEFIIDVVRSMHTLSIRGF